MQSALTSSTAWLSGAAPSVALVPAPPTPTVPAPGPSHDVVLAAQLPTDPASIFAILLILVVAGAVIWYGRPRGGGGGPAK